MITCEGCSTEYEDFASYCNLCDKPLTDETGTSLEVSPAQDSEARKQVLTGARKTASTVHRVLGWFYFVLMFLTAIFYIALGNPVSATDYPMLLVLALPAMIHLVTAEGLTKGKPWARPVSIVVGVVLLVGFPIGTVLGVILLSQMLKKEWKQS